MVTNVCFKNTFVRNLLNERIFEFSDICPSTIFNMEKYNMYTSLPYLSP